MKSPTAAMFYFLWVQSRYKIAGTAGACIAIAALLRVLLWIFPGSGFVEEGAQLHLLLQGVILVVMCSFMTVFPREDKPNSVGPQSYSMLMPLRTSRIVIGYMLFVIVVTGVLTIGLIVVDCWVLGFPTTSSLQPDLFRLWHFPLLCICLVILGQCGGLISDSPNEIVGALAALVLFFLGASCVFPLTSQRFSMLGVPIWTISVVCAYGLSCLGVGQHRYQRWQALWPILRDWLSVGRGRTRPFKNADRALAWYVWRRNGAIGLGLAVVFPILWTILVVLDIRHDPPLHPASKVVAAILMTVGAGAFYVGVAALGFHSVTGGIAALMAGSSHLYVQPIRTVRFANTVLLAFAGILATALGISTAIMLVGFRLGLPPNLWAEVHAQDVFVSAVAIGAGGWILWYAVPLFYLPIVAGAVSLAGHYALGMNALATFLWTSAALYVLTIVADLAFAARRLERTTAVYMTAAWIAGLCAAGVIAAGAGSLLSPPPLTTAHHAALFAATLLVPLPFCDLPRLIDRYRRR